MIIYIECNICYIKNNRPVGILTDALVISLVVECVYYSFSKTLLSKKGKMPSC